MAARGLDDVMLHGHFWPETHSVKHILSRFAEKDRHVIAIMDADPPILVVSLFGKYDAFLPLGELTEGTNPTARRDGTVWRIEIPSRRLSRFTLGDFVAERCREARRQTGKVNEC
ncbi:MAG TPA: hypothetical protein VFU86_03570 [Terriglobales bacterium]|jgi:hypothetical protein|nr:hypothetical protein [Terriglobales bacterium]